ncbi:uncharacterized protein LOC133372789 [Rhineura floridana]|uniref:uncharacterized protein LOC133372789 n=1 Tax=Rhineura floridana TaxID=261503 RepID=UPI002AC8419B|nr:uncharacterized protein LOC133372789 [Rhineura floridana]
MLKADSSRASFRPAPLTLGMGSQEMSKYKKRRSKMVRDFLSPVSIALWKMKTRNESRLPMVLASLGPQELSRPPRLIWADLVFPVPQRQVGSKGATKERAALRAASQGHPRSEGCNVGQGNRTTKLWHLHLGCIPEDEAEERGDSVAPKCPAANLPSIRETEGAQERRAVKKILVDLRPILENVVDLSDYSQEEPSERDPQNDGQPSWKGGGLSSEGLVERGGCHAAEAATASSTDGGVYKDISLPPTEGPFQAPRLHAESADKTPKGIHAQPGDSTEFQKSNRPALVTPEPKLRTTASFPQTTPHQWAPLETDSAPQPERLAAPLPDSGLPTHLLLQSLQETMTSRHHLLITQVLSSLREELLGDDLRLGYSTSRDKGNGPAETPSSKVLKNRKVTGGLQEFKPGPAAAKRTLSKFTWHRNRSVYEAGSEAQLPDL